MDKKEIKTKFKNFEKEYKILSSRINEEFGEEDAFDKQYCEFRDEFLDEIIKDDGDWYYLDQNMDIIVLNMYVYICVTKLNILRKAHSSFWFNFIDDSSFKLKYMEISNKINEIAPKEVIVLEENFIEEIRNIEKIELKKLVIISEQSEKAKKNSMFFTVGIGAIFALLGAILSNLDRISGFFIELPSISFSIIISVIPLILGLLTVLFIGFLKDKIL